MNPADITVLIPAAGRVPEGLLALSNIACPAMIPIAGRPVIHWTMSYLRSLGVRKFVIAVARPKMFVEDFVDSAFGQDCDVRFIVPSLDGGLGQTVLELSAHVQTPAALVVLGDTHFHFASDALPQSDDEPLVLTHPVEDSYRWCVAEATSDGVLQQLHDKVAGLTAPLDALIGVYYFPDARRLHDAAHDTVAVAQTAGRRAEMAGILGRVHAVTPVRVARARTWLDCGNADMQSRSHQALLQARAFNELAIDTTLGTITKRSKHTEKFIDEVNYLRLLPRSLQVLFPRVIDYSTEWADPWVTLEYYGYPSLAEVFLFENVDPGIWERVFAHLSSVLERFAAFPRPLPDGALWDMYITKSRRRLASLHDHPVLGPLVQHDGPIEVNGAPLANLPALWPRIEAAVRDLEATTRGAVIHGDLCLSNILYDLRSRTCKLIDPRGSFGSVGIYGDPRYDLAKLWHSIHGLYDFIANDVFRVTVDGTRIDLSVRATPAHREIETRFERVFFAKAATRREVQLVTALLFTSMPALHYDNPQRQVAMYTRALQLFAEYFAEAE